jgi:hypothetical protein
MAMATPIPVKPENVMKHPRDREVEGRKLMKDVRRRERVIVEK